MPKRRVVVNSKPYAFRLSAADVKALYELAKAYGTNRSGVVRILIHQAYGSVKTQEHEGQNGQAN